MTTSTHSSSLTPSSSRKTLLLSPNLGLDQPKTCRMAEASPKDQSLPPTPPPKQDASLSVTFIGASALSLLGSAVMGLGSTAASALASPSSTEVENSVAKSPSAVVAKDEPTTLLGSISNALLTRAACVRDTAIETASATANAATHAVVDSAMFTLGFTLAPSSSNQNDHVHITTTSVAKVEKDVGMTNTVARASTLPLPTIQLTATGEPFSTNPSISAMQLEIFL
uniref:Uncharacterized protein n=1 Tax=Melanopsichium pennsylvanicum 4 TaxID=1398559 RepID=A0A077R797_9BASI|nr:putative protein [Melanopsichium pennsylvanicum 4]